jgi:hypothetical protein
MKKNLSKLIGSLIVAGLAASAQAQTELITFDDLPANFAIPNGYAGLSWNNFYALNGVNYNAGDGVSASGYANGLVSPNNVVYNAEGNPAYIIGGQFNLNSAYLTAAWNNGLQLEVQGFVGGTLSYDNTYTVNATGPALINFNYLGVDRVNFISSGGVNAGFGDSGEQFAMDNLSATIVPEPTTLAMAGLSGLSLMLFRRRRK